MDWNDCYAAAVTGLLAGGHDPQSVAAAAAQVADRMAAELEARRANRRRLRDLASRAKPCACPTCGHTRATECNDVCGCCLNGRDGHECWDV